MPNDQDNAGVFAFRTAELGAPAPAPTRWPTSAAGYVAQIPSYYTCGCGQLVRTSDRHQCWCNGGSQFAGVTLRAGDPLPSNFFVPSVSDSRSAAALERIATALEKIAVAASVLTSSAT